MLFQRLLPKPHELLEQGTDYSFEGRFVDTLSFNHFTKEDFSKLQQIHNLIAPYKEEMVKLLHDGLKKINPKAAQIITTQHISHYIQSFFHMERDRAYVNESLRFFHLLRKDKYWKINCCI